MMELTINGVVYSFHFGMGFMREINKRVTKTPNPDAPEVKQHVGLQFAVAGLLDGDVETLVDVLNVANKGQARRITENALCQYIDDESTDIDALFESVLDFLKRANATRKVTLAVMDVVAKAAEQAEAT